jgi:hypothetical protein
VDNTSDADKPVSTATTTALNLKMDKTGGTFSGDINTSNNINLSGTASQTSDATRIDFRNGASKIYDNFHLNIITDDYMYITAPTSLNITSTTSNFNGTVNIKNTSSNLNFFKLTNNTKPTQYLDFYNYEPDGYNYMDIWNGSLNIRYVNGGYYNRIVVTSAGVDLTGTVTGITKTMVGLSNVDNTSDANKPVSTAQQSALDLKMDKTGGTFGGDVTMNSSKNIIVSGTGKIEFGSNTSEKIILWKNTVAYGNYGLSIENSTTRYNVASGGKHIFSSGKSDGTKYEDIMSMSNSAIITEKTLSAGGITCSALTSTGAIVGGSSLTLNSGGISCGGISCGGISCTSLSSTGAITCGGISSSGISCSSITVNSIKTYYMNCSCTDSNNLGSGNGREITINFPTSKTFTTCAGAIVQIVSSSLSNYQFVVTRVTAHNYSSVNVLIWNGSGSGITPSAYTYNVIAWGT